MIYLVLAGIIAFVSVTFLFGIASDWDWSCIWGWWGLIALVATFGWLLAKGLSEVVR